MTIYRNNNKAGQFSIFVVGLRIDNEYRSAHLRTMVVRCGWMMTGVGRCIFVTAIDDVYRSLSPDEYNAMVEEATRRCDNPASDDLTVHFSSILAEWSI